MKKLLVICIAAVISLAVAGSAMAEMKSAPAGKPKDRATSAGQSPQATLFPAVDFDPKNCPPGFPFDPAQGLCVRPKPANPCAQGYRVEWGPCSNDCYLSTDKKCADCSYRCIPEGIIIKFDCAKKYGPGAYFINDSCRVGCRPPVQ